MAERIDALDWDELREQLDHPGHAITVPLLDAGECEELAVLFDGGNFRSTIDMARHRFGEAATATSTTRCRTRSRRCGRPSTGTWRRSRTTGRSCSAVTPSRFPLTHEELLERCRAAGQERPTPLILRYGEGDWNALHQDLYGDVYFPFQVLTVLSEPGVDYDGGEFVLMEQRPRAQSRAHVLMPPRGAFVIFPTRQRPTEAERLPPRRACATASRPSRGGRGRRWG